MLKIGMYRYYWNKFPVFEKADNPTAIGISVIVAFRNEESSLPRLLASLNKQVYPEALREIILVDDHSDDMSLKIAMEYARNHARFSCLSNEVNEKGKKAAIYKGMQHARFGLIAFTDADCTMEDNWLSSVSGLYSQQNADMIIGLVDMEMKPGLFNRFREIEFLSLVASGAAAAAMGKPIYCNAANLAFHKDLFLSYADPLKRDVPSGDDTLFMLKVKQDPTRRIRLLKSVNGIVTTNEGGTARQFFNQRSRWASKSRHYTDRDILYTAALVLAVSMTLLVSAMALVLGINTWLFPVMLMAKTMIDYLFLRDFLCFYAKRIHPGLFLLFEAVYPVYIVISASLGMFSRYTWKGRKCGLGGA